MRSLKILLIIGILSIQYGFSQKRIEIISSSFDQLIIKVNTRLITAEDLKPFDILIGLPSKTLPNIQLESKEESKIEKIKIKDIFKTEWINNQIVNGLNTGTLRISPISTKISYYTSMLIKLSFEKRIREHTIASNSQKILLSPRIINWNISKNWVISKLNSTKKLPQLPKGEWIQFTIGKDGIFKLTGKQILDLLKINVNLDPRSIMLFTSSSLGRDRTYHLSQKISKNFSIPDNLVEISIAIDGESDGNLGNDDIMYFYGQGPSGFNFNNNTMVWHQNLYFTESNYWLLIPSDNTLRGKRIQTANKIQEGNKLFDYGISYIHLETDKENPQNSGLGWGNSIVAKTNSFLQKVNLIKPISSKNANGSFGMIGNESIKTKYKNTEHRVLLSLSGKELSSLTWSNIGLKSANFIIEPNTLIDGDQTFEITNNINNPNSLPLFDFLSLSYFRELEYRKPFDFISPINSTNATFRIKGTDLKIWNITDIINPKNLPLNISEGIISSHVTLPINKSQRFYTFKIEDIISPPSLTYQGLKEWTTLRNTSKKANHLIIGPQTFFSATVPLINHRAKTLYASLDNIYQEFSAGNKDPIGIRHFLQWTQENWEQKPTTVFLVGDADFDYRNITGKSKIIVPTIEVGTNYTYATDDRLTAFNGIIPEMATGRFPARTEKEVSDFIEKIISFETNLPPGIWKQRVTLVADDPARPERESFELFIGKSHTKNSERLAESIPDYIDIKKIYMVDFPEEKDASTFGVTKPEATQALFNQLSKGTAFINYIGHGNSTQWAQEKLIIISDERNDLSSIKTNMKLPIWIAGTCNWGQFDNIDKESFAEELIRSPMDGASAIITTNRGITVSSNIQFLENIFNEIFKGDSLTTKNLGTVIQSIKTGGSDGEIFHLFGDPAMSLPIPKTLIRNGKVSPDTLETLEVGTLLAKSPIESGNGTIVFEDGPSQVTRVFNYASKEEEITYLQKGPTLFKGSFTFSNSTFSPQFRVPKDITYTKNPAKVRFSINDGLNDEAFGSVSGIFLSLGSPSNDVEGPIITFESESGLKLKNGDFLPENQNLIIRISDPMGINLTGEKGHELFINNSLTGKKINAIDQFVYDSNSINTGIILFNISSEIDNISLIISAWDNANNPNEAEIQLVLLKSNKLDMLRVLNFPNPFSEETQFTFELTKDAKVSISIYTISGRKVKSIIDSNQRLGFNRISWNGRDEYGNLLANGVYLYKIRAEINDQKINHIGRLAIFR
tara:strand:+ start:2280 stop:6017 length:3738 start_codon:yes stop_codon:yes gene_type:complete